ncbi:MAG: IS200/IS605 family transposase [Chloroflexi bacterium]|nr:MAG: IS200/IS605 family transposase [Chloroflexota bacterium]
MPYYELYYHLVWSTKHRAPLLTAVIEPIIYQYMRHKAHSLEAIIHALNGIEDHVHMVVTIPPKLAVAKFIGQVKGVASTRFNKEHKEHPPFFWQTEYSAFSFDKKRLPYVIAYVNRQKEHHAQHELIPLLEKDGTEDQQQTIHEPMGIYLPNYDQWFKEMQAT